MYIFQPDMESLLEKKHCICENTWPQKTDSAVDESGWPFFWGALQETICDNIQWFSALDRLDGDRSAFVNQVIQYYTSVVNGTQIAAFCQGLDTHGLNITV